MVLVAVLAGCSSPQRRHYLTLHSIAVEPTASTNNELAAAFGLDDYADPAQTVAAAETEEEAAGRSAPRPAAWLDSRSNP